MRPQPVGGQERLVQPKGRVERQAVPIVMALSAEGQFIALVDTRSSCDAVLFEVFVAPKSIG
jgi:hypothetical protein